MHQSVSEVTSLTFFGVSQKVCVGFLFLANPIEISDVGIKINFLLCPSVSAVK